MTLYFAYGSNMSRAAMQRRCPAARAAGTAMLDGYEFYVGVEGWGSVRPKPGGRVHGVLWRLTPPDMAALHAYELLHTGLYGMRRLAVSHAARRVPVMINLLRRRTPGRARPGYLADCAAAAREWSLPERYVRSLERWSVARRTGRVTDAGEIA